MSFKEKYALPSILACQLSLLLGAAQGFSAVLLPQLRKSLQIDETQGSWIASLGVICRPLGAIIEGYTVAKYGRKRTLQITAFFFALAWIFTALSTNINIVYASRVFLSFTTGMVVCVGLYIAEITAPQDRGTFLSLITPTINCGILIVYVLGYVLYWKIVAVILAVYSGFLFFSINYVPESHIWYMLKNKRTKAANVLLMFRKEDVDAVNMELDQIKSKMSQYEGKTANCLTNFFKPSVWKPFVIFSVFSFFQQQSGYNIIIYYGVTFFENLGSDFPDKHILTLIFASISILGSVILVLIVHKFNRVTLLVSSGLGMSLTMAVAASSLTFECFESHKWIPNVCVFVYIFFCMLGMIDIPWMMIGEVFPNSMRGTMSAAITVVIFFLSFINMKLYPVMNETLSASGVLWYFTVMSLLTVIFAKLYFHNRNKSYFAARNVVVTHGTHHQ